MKTINERAPRTPSTLSALTLVDGSKEPALQGRMVPMRANVCMQSPDFSIKASDLGDMTQGQIDCLLTFGN